MDEPTTELVGRWRLGDEAAATELYERYIERLLGMVSTQLSPKYWASIGADDLCQSAMKSMLRRVRQGHFVFENDVAVWKLLVTIALNKLRNKLKRPVAVSGHGEDGRRFLLDCLSREPGLAEALEFQDLWEEICGHISEAEQEFLRLRMEGYKQKEIAEETGIPTRTLRRFPSRICAKVAHLFAMDAPSDDNSPAG